MVSFLGSILFFFRLSRALLLSYQSRTARSQRRCLAKTQIAPPHAICWGFLAATRSIKAY